MRFELNLRRLRASTSQRDRTVYRQLLINPPSDIQEGFGDHEDFFRTLGWEVERAWSSVVGSDWESWSQELRGRAEEAVVQARARSRQDWARFVANDMQAGGRVMHKLLKPPPPMGAHHDPLGGRGGSL